MDDNFEKHIRQTMRQPPEYPFEEGMWRRMNDRLSGKRSNRKFAWLWFIPLFLLALIPSFFLWKITGEQQQTSHELAELKSMITTMARDTVYVREVVRDTLVKYKYKVKYKNKIENPTTLGFTGILRAGNEGNGINGGNESDENPTSLKLRRAGNGINVGDEVYGNQGFVISDLEDGAFEKNLDYLDTRFPLLAIGEEELSDFSPIEVEGRERAAPPFYGQFIPSGYRLSGSGGMLQALNIPNHDNEASFNGKVELEVRYGSGWNLVGGLEFLPHKVEIKQEDINAELLTDLPGLNPRDPADQLTEIKGNFHYLQVPVGLRYHFSKKGIIQPYFGFGWVPVFPIRSTLAFQYVGQRESYEVSQTSLLKDQHFLSEYWFQLGATMPIQSSWYALIDFSGQINVKKSRYRYENHQFLKVNLGLGYEF